MASASVSLLDSISEDKYGGWLIFDDHCETDPVIKWLSFK